MTNFYSWPINPSCLVIMSRNTPVFTTKLETVSFSGQSEIWREGVETVGWLTQPGSPPRPTLVLDLRLTLWTLHWLSPLIKVDSEPESSAPLQPNNGSEIVLIFSYMGDFYKMKLFLHFQIDEYYLRLEGRGGHHQAPWAWEDPHYVCILILMVKSLI